MPPCSSDCSGMRTTPKRERERERTKKQCQCKLPRLSVCVTGATLSPGPQARNILRQGAAKLRLTHEAQNVPAMQREPNIAARPSPLCPFLNGMQVLRVSFAQASSGTISPSFHTCPKSPSAPHWQPAGKQSQHNLTPWLEAKGYKCILQPKCSS